MVSPDLWLSVLTTLPRDDQTNKTNLVIYASCVAAAVLLTTLRAYAFFLVVLKSSENLHNDMVKAILTAPVLFFDSNTIGRILNRFSKDIGCMDEVLPKTFLFVVQIVLFVLTAAVVPLVAKMQCMARSSCCTYHITVCLHCKIFYEDIKRTQETGVYAPQSCVDTDL